MQQAFPAFRSLQCANIKKWGRGSGGQFHTNHCVLSTRPSTWCLSLQECGKGLWILCQKVDVSGPLLRRQPWGYSRNRPFWVVAYGEVRGAVPDPDLKTRGGGGGGRAGHQDPEIRRGRVSTKVFSALQASVWSKNKWGPSPPDPPLGRFDCVKLKLLIWLTI